MPKITEGGQYMRWLHEFLCSVSVAWLVLRREFVMERSSLLGTLVNYPPYRYLREYLYPDISRDHFYGRLADFIGLSLLCGLVIFFFLRLLSPFRLTKAFLHTIAGAIVIAGFPLMCLRDYGFLSFSARAARWPLLVEVLLVLACAAFYLYRRWPVPAPVSILLLALHVALWSWATESYVGWTWLAGMFRLANVPFGRWAIWWNDALLLIFIVFYPILGFCSSLAWGIYVRQTDEPRQTPKPVPAQ
jgi:hypothetical protein